MSILRFTRAVMVEGCRLWLFLHGTVMVVGRVRCNGGWVRIRVGITRAVMVEGLALGFELPAQ